MSATELIDPVESGPSDVEATRCPPAASLPAQSESSDSSGAEAISLTDSAQPPVRDRFSFLRAMAKGVGVGVLVILVVVALATIIVPGATGSRTYTISGRSMEPTLPLGTLIVSQPVDPAEIKIGDVITFQLVSGEPTVATHRVVGFEFTAYGRNFVTAGDNNDGSIDVDPVLPEQLMGRLWYSVPMVGWINFGVTGPLRAWLVPIAIVGLFVYGGWMVVGGVISRARRPKQSQSQSQS